MRPDARYRAVKSLVKTGGVRPIDDLDRALYDFLATGLLDGVVDYACDIHESEFRREILQAWIAANATSQQIHDCLRTPVDVINAYRHLFFNIGVFRDDLDLFDWVHEYNGTDYGKTLLMQAVSTGVQGLMWQFNRGDANIDPKGVLRQIMTDAHFRAAAGRMGAVGSAEAAAALRHMTVAMSAANALVKNDTGNLLADLFIKLQHRELTTSIAEEPAEDQPLH